MSSNLFPVDKDKFEKKYQQEDSVRKEGQFICKICFRTDSDIQDPLISPCKCAGSMGYIHYKCLKQCINMKINTKVGDNYMCYIWKNFECEICLSEYPKVIKYKDLTYNLVDLNFNYDQYMILDYTLYDDAKKRSFRKGIIVVRVNDDEDISIGRTQTNTIKLKDISVSRVHCFLTKKDNRIYVSDKGSKFGTLLYLNKPFTLSNSTTKSNANLNVDSHVSLISGKNHFNFKLTHNWNFFSNFFSSTLCCKCKNATDDEFIINIDDLGEENEITKIKEQNNYLNDSYCDYVLNLDTIIKCNESNNNNNSFI
jgi:hypothetical protein